MSVAWFAVIKGDHLAPRPRDHHSPRHRSVTHICYPYSRKIPLGLVVGKLPCKRRVLAVSLQDTVGPGPRSMFGAPLPSPAPTAPQASQCVRGAASRLLPIPSTARSLRASSGSRHDKRSRWWSCCPHTTPLRCLKTLTKP